MAVEQEYVMSSYQRAVEELSVGEAIWNPFQLIYVNQGGSEVNQWTSFVSSMVTVGILVLLLMATLRLVSILLDELNEIPATTAIIGVLLEFAFCGVLLLNYSAFAEVFPNIFHRLTRAIFSGYGSLILKDAADGLSVAALEKTSENKWFSITFSLASIPQLISSILTGLAMAMMWVVSKYQAVIYTFWYLVGPFLLPFYLFRPFRGVAVTWFRSLLGAAFMGVVGSILFILMHKAGWLMKAFSSGHNSSYISALVFALCCLFLMFSIPSLSQSIWSGIAASVSRGVYASSALLGGAAGAAVLGGGGAAVAAGALPRAVGGAVGALSRYRSTSESGMSLGGRVSDAIRNRSAGITPGGALDRIHGAGQAMTRAGGRAVLSQLPSAVGRAANAVGLGGNSRLSPQQRAKESQRAVGHIRERLAARHGQDSLSALDFSRFNFSRRPGESFDDAIDRHSGFYEGQIEKAKDASDIRSYIAQHHGEEEASLVHVDPRRNWNLPKDASRQDAIAQAARQVVSRNRLMSDIGAVRRSAESIVGPDRASKIDWSQVKPLKMKKGQTQEQAAEEYAMTLLYRAKAFTPDEVKAHDHAAIRREITRKLGAEKGDKVTIPDDWRVKPKRGQSRQDAIAGSTVALLQDKGFIDRSGQNRVAERHSVRSRIRAKAERERLKKEGLGQKDKES